MSALIAALLLLGSTFFIQQYATRSLVKSGQIMLDKQVRGVAATLSSSLLVRLNLTHALHAFVSAQPFFSAQEFDQFASTLKIDLPGVISLQLAPGGVVTYLTDIERNKAALARKLHRISR